MLRRLAGTRRALMEKICPDNVLADLEPAGDVVADVAVPLGDLVHRWVWILCLSCERGVNILF